MEDARPLGTKARGSFVASPLPKPLKELLGLRVYE